MNDTDFARRMRERRGESPPKRPAVANTLRKSAEERFKDAYRAMCLGRKVLLVTEFWDYATTEIHRWAIADGVRMQGQRRKEVRPQTRSGVIFVTPPDRIGVDTRGRTLDDYFIDPESRTLNSRELTYIKRAMVAK